MLMAHGAEPNVVDEMFMSPLHYASAWGHTRAVDRLMANGIITSAHPIKYLLT